MADQDIEETAKEIFEEESNGLPEAPVSINVRGYYKGFSVQITKRSATSKVELEKIVQAIDNMVEKGFKPSWKDEPEQKKSNTAWLDEGKDDERTKTCQCGGEKTLKTGVKNSKKWAGWFCSEKCEYSPEWVSLKKT